MNEIIDAEYTSVSDFMPPPAPSATPLPHPPGDGAGTRPAAAPSRAPAAAPVPAPQINLGKVSVVHWVLIAAVVGYLYGKSKGYELARLRSAAARAAREE